jgi:hypothetical protein
MDFEEFKRHYISVEDYWNQKVAISGNYEGISIRERSLVVKKKRMAKVQYRVIQLSGGLINKLSRYETEKGDAQTAGDDLNGVKRVYQDESWSQKIFIYDLKAREFMK